MLERSPLSLKTSSLPCVTGHGASFFELLPYCLHASFSLWLNSHAFDLRFSEGSVDILPALLR